MSGGITRSGWIGLIGVVVVTVLIAVIVSTTSNPKVTVALVFGVIAVLIVIVFLLDRSNLKRAAEADARDTARAAAEGGRELGNPTTMTPPELWAAMAVKPIDSEAIHARSQMLDARRRSLDLGMVVTLLILITMPSIYLFESILPLLIGGPPIAIAVVYGTIRTIGPGGEVGKGFDRMDRAMRPLGLSVARRPKVRFETTEPAMPSFSARLSEPTIFDGERYGRTVSIQIGGYEDAGTSEVIVAASTPEFAARSSDGRVKPGDDAPPPIQEALKVLPSSTRWEKLSVKGSDRGIVVARKNGHQADWLCDLWLAERLAQA